MLPHVMSCRGKEILPWIGALASLRIEIFREFPYLYEGDEKSERGFLEHFLAAPESLFVVAFAGDEVVGVSTAMPLKDAPDEFRQPFYCYGMESEEVDKVFYFGESVLLPQWRGRGLGHCFFDEREYHARSLGYETATFCAVDREDNHPLKPPGYQPLHGFWGKRGYTLRPEFVAQLEWKQIDSQEEVRNTLTFWTKSLV